MWERPAWERPERGSGIYGRGLCRRDLWRAARRRGHVQEARGMPRCGDGGVVHLGRLGDPARLILGPCGIGRGCGGGLVHIRRLGDPARVILCARGQGYDE